jgi:hypothetical protein
MEQFEWAKNLNPKGFSIFRILRGRNGSTLPIEDDIEMKRKKREDAEKGILLRTRL